METKHTEGPWKVSKDGCDVENANGAGVCAIYADETSEANARLIAAAPALLEACKRLDAAAEEHFFAEPKDCGCEMCCARRQVQATIALAEKKGD